MAEELQLGLDAVTTSYVRDMDVARKVTRGLDADMGNLLAAVSQLEKELKGLSSKFKIDVDSKDIARAESQIKSLDNISPQIEVTADTSKAESDIKAIESTLPTPVVKVSADVSKADSEIKAIDDSLPSPTVPVDADTSAAVSALDAFKALALTGVVVTVATAITSAPIISGVVGRDQAVNALSAKTGLAEGEAGAAFDELYTGAYGESASEIANNIALTEQLDIQTGTLASNTATAWDTANVISQDYQKTLEVMDKLVKNGLAPDFQAASDLIVGGFQDGADRSGDLLDSLREYSTFFAQAGYSGEAAINLMVQALELGTFNTDKLGDVVKENILKITEAVGDVGGAGGTAKPILEKYKLLDEAALVGQAEEIGGLSAAQFAAIFLDTLNTELAAGNIDQAGFNFALTEVFGTPIEDLGFEVWKGLDFTAAAAAEGSFEGIGAEAAIQINDNLATAFTSVGRTIELEIVKTLADAGIDLNEILDGVKDKAVEIGTLIRSGVALPESLEIALEMPGLANTLHGIESVMGNVYIAFLDIIAKVQDLGGDTEGAAATRGMIAKAGATQLAFDIKLAGDAKDALRLIETAQGRGVDAESISTAINTATTELIDAGNIQDAQDLLDSLKNIPPATVEVMVTRPNGEGGFDTDWINLPVHFGVDPEDSQVELDIAVQAAIAEYEQGTGFDIQPQGVGELVFNEPIDTSAGQAAIDNAVNALYEDWDTAAAAKDWAGALNIAEQLGDADLIGVSRDAIGAAANSLFSMLIPQTTGTGLGGGAPVGARPTDDIGTGSDPVATFAAGLITTIDTALSPAQTALAALTGTLGTTTETLTATDQPLDDATTGFADLKTGVGDTDLQLGIFGETVLVTMTNAEANLLATRAGIIESFNLIRDAAKEAKNEIAGVTTPDGGADGDPTTPYAAGGIGKAGMITVGEHGQETMFADTSFAVWNNRTTDAFNAGMNIGMGGGGRGDTYNTIYLTNTFNTSDINQALGASDNVVRQLRGLPL